MSNPSIGATFVAALFLASAYVFGLKLKARSRPAGRNWISVSAGASIAYVFIYVMPELAEHQSTYLSSSVGQEIPFAEKRVYLSALAGFVVFYVVENLIAFNRRDAPSSEAAAESRALVHRLHTAGFAAYSFLTAFLLVDWADKGAESLVLFTVALFLHFLVIDHSLRSEHKSLHDSSGRWVLALSVMLGWAAGWLVSAPDRVLASLVGFMSGGVIINSVKDEMPAEGEVRALPFTAGAAVYALVLLLL